MTTALWIIGGWFAGLCILSFIFGMTKILFDDDWGIFVIALTMVWPLVTATILLALILSVLFALLYLVVRTIGCFGAWVGRRE